jgi:hypothetical protein
MREPAWNKRVSICSLAHAAILNVWSSNCSRAISPRQRRTRNHQPVPTLTPKVVSERRSRNRYHVAIKHAQRSASCPCRRHGGHLSDSKAPRRRAAGRTSGTGACSARGTRPSRGRPAHRRSACGAAPAARSTAPDHRRTTDGATSAPRRATASCAAFRRLRTRRRHGSGHTSRPRTWAEGSNGRRSGGRETPGRSRWTRSCPACVAGAAGTSASGVRATAGRPTTGSGRPSRAGREALSPTRPGYAAGKPESKRSQPHLAQ